MVEPDEFERRVGPSRLERRLRARFIVTADRQSIDRVGNRRERLPMVTPVRLGAC